MLVPFISICIPAYKRTDFLRRLLDSIAMQTFHDFEVIITDDSNDDSVAQLTAGYEQLFPIVYQKNNPALGSPENWNAGIRRAKGDWIKIMHDDDWFAAKESLQTFADAAINHADCSFIFSGFTQVDIDTQQQHSFVIKDWQLRLLQSSPLSLFKENVIGHPSTTLIKKDKDHWYDKNLKWVVDIEFYMRYLHQHPHFYAIPKPLINIGISKFQITKEAFRNPAIEIPEVLYLYYHLPKHSLRNIFAYDYYWRFVRNLSIRSGKDIKRYAPDMVIPTVIKNMIQLQKKFPVALLKKGVVSKSLMLLSYSLNFFRL